MKKHFSLILKIVISIALVVLTIKFMKLDLMDTFHTLKNSNWKWFVLCCLALYGTIFTNTYRWMILANQLDYKLQFPEALKMYFEAMFSNNFLPSNFGGDAWRSYELGRKDKAWLKAASTVIMERLFGFTMMFALMPIALIAIRFSEFKGAIPEKIELALWMSFGGMVFLYATYFLWSKINLGFIKKIKFTLDEYTSCHKSMQTVTLWTFITHVFLMLSNIFAALATYVSFDQIPFWFWFIVVPTSTLLSFVIPALKGVGAKEASYIYLLAFIGIGSSDALAIAFLVFLGTLIATLPGISIVFRSKNKMPETDPT
jgi:glycosyltransferase 2 family protein